jgi:Bacterial DNA-binding protein
LCHLGAIALYPWANFRDSFVSERETITDPITMATKPAAPKTPAKGGARAATRPKLVADADAAVEDGDTQAKGRAGSGLRLKDLVDRVVEATGGKKKGVKEIVEATLTQLGAALAKGESLNLPSLGKMRVARAGAEGGGAMTLKLRQGPGGGGKAKTANEPLADADDQD